MLGTIAVMFSKQGDYFAFSFYTSKEDLGVYYFSYQLIFAVVVFFITISEFIILPLFAKKKDEKQELNDLFITILSGSTLLSIAVSTGIYFFIGDIIQYIWSGKWDDSISLVKIMTLLIVFLNIYYISRAVCDALGMWKVRNILNIIYGLGIICVAALSASHMEDLHMITLAIVFFHVIFSVIQLVVVCKIAKFNVLNIFYTLIY